MLRKIGNINNGRDLQNCKYITDKVGGKVIRVEGTVSRDFLTSDCSVINSFSWFCQRYDIDFIFIFTEFEVPGVQGESIRNTNIMKICQTDVI